MRPSYLQHGKSAMPGHMILIFKQGLDQSPEQPYKTEFVRDFPRDFIIMIKEWVYPWSKDIIDWTILQYLGGCPVFYE